MPESSAVKRWLQLASEYEQLADNIAGTPHIAGQPQTQQVAMQQQQVSEEPRGPEADDKSSG